MTIPLLMGRLLLLPPALLPKRQKPLPFWTLLFLLLPLRRRNLPRRHRICWICSHPTGHRNSPSPRVAQRADALHVTFPHPVMDHSEATCLVESAGVIGSQESKACRRVERVTDNRQRTSDAATTQPPFHRPFGDRHGDRPICEPS